MLTLSKDMAKILEANTRTRNVDTAEVQEDLQGLRVVAAQVLTKERLGAEDYEVNAVGVILLDKPTGEIVAKGTRSQNRANRFRKAAGIAQLEEKLHYTVSRTEPTADVVKTRLALDEDGLKNLPAPFNEAPWGWVLVNFTEAGLAELGHWGETQDKVADLVTEYCEAYQAAKLEAPSAEPTENGEVQEPAAAGGRKR